MNAAELETLAKKAYEASLDCATLTTAQRNGALIKIAQKFRAQKDEILAVNANEVQQAKDAGLESAFVDRLNLTEKRFEEMVSGIEQVAALPDPLNRIYDGRTVPSGLFLCKRSVPLGVVGVIFEARPNVVADISALCLKSGNVCLLRGGRESLKTGACLHRLIAQALSERGIDPAAVGFIDSPEHELVDRMLRLDKYLSVIIPRGGVKLQRLCAEKSSVPVITGGFGISHIFADASCDQARALPLIVNAKVQKPSACNALDTLLVHEAIAKEFVPKVLEALKAHGVEVLAHGKALELCRGFDNVKPGADEDFDTEFLSLRMNLAVVRDVRAACAHLRAHRASHSDSILTDSHDNARLFVSQAGSACVYVNASTRFSDGGQFGLGAEVAISTQKLHARGPMGLEALTTYQYVCEGDYLCRK